MGRQPEVHRFLAMVEVQPNGCWYWTGRIGHDGYGRFKVGSKTKQAHRESIRIFWGDIPEGMVACHTCDTPRCVNPNHFFVGTHGENMRDMRMKRRSAGGERNVHNKLTAEQVAEVREYLDAGWRPKSIAREMDGAVTATQIARIASGDRWSEEGTLEQFIKPEKISFRMRY